MTCSPNFYANTQRLFLALYEGGLAYRAEALVNWDPLDRTVLANEQVDGNGFSWRSGAKVQQLKLKQWFIKITDIAEQLLHDLEILEADNRWPQHVIAMQRNWLGRSEGTNIRFKLHYSAVQRPLDLDDQLQVFTTRPDTLFGVQYLALSVDHPISQYFANDHVELQSFIEQVEQLEPDTKVGFRLPSVVAQNPLDKVAGDNGIFKDLPVFVAPYVRSDYGSGAVMGVPAHDSRDYEFWKQNTGEEPRVVVEPELNLRNQLDPTQAYTDLGYLSAVCGQYSGMDSTAAAKRIQLDLAAQDQNISQTVTKWRLRDWLISRQRYWGCPIPIVHCDSCGAVPIPDEDLPVRLPSLDENQWNGATGNPLELDKQWCNTSCPICGQSAKRETDTMDTFVDSSWYYMRFAEAAEAKEVSSPFMPVDLYIGGVEHAILHLLYARFIYKFLRNRSGNPTVSSEPFERLLTQGMVHGKTFSNPDTGRFLKPEELDFSDQNQPRIRATNQIVTVSYEKMSKSKYNGVDPLQCMQTYGTDVTRAHLLFQAPPTEVLEWDEEKIVGVQRWFARLWNLAHQIQCGSLLTEGIAPHSNAEVKLWRSVQSTTTSVDQSFSTTFALNTIISDLMTLTNDVQQALKEKQAVSNALLHQSLSILLRLLTPIAPSFSEECWAVLHQHNDEFSVERTASRAGFPEPDGSLERLQESTQPCAIQVNGKLKFVVDISNPPSDLDQQGLKDWIVPQVLRSEQWSGAASKAGWDIEKARKIIAVRGGRVMNIVF